MVPRLPVGSQGGNTNADLALLPGNALPKRVDDGADSCSGRDDREPYDVDAPCDGAGARTGWVPWGESVG